MVKEIECPGGNLEDFILYGEQVPAYRSFHGEPDPEKTDKKIIEYYRKGNKYAEQFKDGKEFIASLIAHVGLCHKCSEEKGELEIKYKNINKEELKKLTKQQINNLRDFNLLD